MVKTINYENAIFLKSEWAEQTFVVKMVWSLYLHGNSGVHPVHKVIFHFNWWLHNYIWGAAHLVVDSCCFAVDYCPTCRFSYSFHLTKRPSCVRSAELVTMLHTWGSKLKTFSPQQNLDTVAVSPRVAPKCVESAWWQHPWERKRLQFSNSKIWWQIIHLYLYQSPTTRSTFPFIFDHLFFRYVKTHLKNS